MSEGDKYTCPLCVRALQQQERREQRKAEAAAAAEMEREAKEAQAARKAKLVCRPCSDTSREESSTLVLMCLLHSWLHFEHVCHQKRISFVVYGHDKTGSVAISVMRKTMLLQQALIDRNSYVLLLCRAWDKALLC